MVQAHNHHLLHGCIVQLYYVHSDIQYRNTIMHVLLFKLIDKYIILQLHIYVQRHVRMDIHIYLYIAQAKSP